MEHCICPCMCNIMTKGDLTQSSSPSPCSVQVCKLQLKQNSTLCVSAPVWGYKAMLYVSLINVSLQWGVAPVSCVSRFLLFDLELVKGTLISYRIILNSWIMNTDLLFALFSFYAGSKWQINLIHSILFILYSAMLLLCYNIAHITSYFSYTAACDTVTLVQMFWTHFGCDELAILHNPKESPKVLLPQKASQNWLHLFDYNHFWHMKIKWNHTEV